MTVDDLSKDKLEHAIFKVVTSSEYQGKEIDGLKLNVKDTKRSSVLVHLQSNGENVKLVVEKGIVEGDLSSFIRHLLDDENIKIHMTQGHKYKVSVSLHSKNKQKIFSGIYFPSYIYINIYILYSVNQLPHEILVMLSTYSVMSLFR